LKSRYSDLSIAVQLSIAGGMTMYSNTLVPLDTNQQDDYWLKAPLELAVEMGGSGTSIHLMSAIPLRWLEGFYPNIYRHELAEKSKKKLETIAKMDCLSDRRVNICVEEGGVISSDILEVADDLSADAIVMASHMPMLKDYVLGSHAAHVALHAPCSVFVARTPTCSKILVPVDTNYEHDDWLKALFETACEKAKKFQASMLVLSVIPDLVVGGFDRQINTLVENTKDKLDAIVGKYCPPNLRIDVSVVSGGISHEILRIAREQSIDVIVMASHGPIYKDYFIGSNAAHVALHAPCSVHIVRSES
jgi:nucleotide-binding universal stress UspA family protein